MRVRIREEIAAALRRASQELRSAAGMIQDLEHVVGRAVLRAETVGADQIVELQSLDHVGQSLLGVADFLDAIGDSSRPEWTVDAESASQCVLLADLGGRLSGAIAPSDAVISPESYELF